MKNVDMFKASLVDSNLTIDLNEDVKDCLTDAQIEEIFDGIGNLSSFICNCIVENRLNKQ